MAANFNSNLLVVVLCILVLMGLPDSAETIPFSKAWNQVHMEMENRLASSFPVILKDVQANRFIGRLYGAGDFRNSLEHICRNFFGKLIDIFFMYFRNHKGMSLSNLADIQESKDMLILIYFGRRDLAIDYFTKNAIAHFIHPFLVSRILS